MSDELGAAPVEQPVAPVATPPNVPAAQSDDVDALKAKLALIQQDNARKGETNKKLDAELQQLKTQFQEAQKQMLKGKHAQLQEQGEFKTLWEEAKQSVSQREAEIADLRQQLEQVQQTVAQERLHAQAMASISDAGAINPKHMLVLMQSNLRQNEEGKPVVLNGGVEQPIGDYLANLKQSAEWQHHFGASTAAGMNAAPTGSVAPGMNNPFRRESWNVTNQMMLIEQNPELAAALKAEAKRG